MLKVSTAAGSGVAAGTANKTHEAHRAKPVLGKVRTRELIHGEQELLIRLDSVLAAVRPYGQVFIHPSSLNKYLIDTVVFDGSAEPWQGCPFLLG